MSNYVKQRRRETKKIELKKTREIMTSPRSRTSPTPSELFQEMEKYFKYFFYKMCQVVVQSRQGEKMMVKSVPVPLVKNWFCLGIEVIIYLFDLVNYLLLNSLFSRISMRLHKKQERPSMRS